MRDSKIWGLPLILFVVALGIRLLGIGWGLPNEKHISSLHPDEGLIWQNAQAIEPTHLKFTPGFYNYGTLYLTTLKIASDMTSAYTGGFDPKKPETVYAFMGRSELAGRLINAFAGAGMALVVFLMLRRLTNDFGAMFGGLLIAIAPAHVVHSRFQTVDILAAFLLTVSAFYALQFVNREGETPKRSDMKLAILSGVFAGLSGSTKYTGILCLVTIFVVLFMTRRPSWLKLSAVALGSAFLAFVITTPGVLLDSQKFITAFLFEMKHTSEGHGLIFEGTSSGFIYHLANLFVGVGMILSLCGLAGLGAGAYKKHAWAIGLLAFFLLYYIVIGRAEVKFIRYTFPLYLGLGIGFGWLIGRAQEKAGKWRFLVALGILGLGGFEAGGLRGTAIYTAWMSAPDPREQAGDYLRDKNVVGLATDPWFYTPTIHPELGNRMVYQEGMPYPVQASYELFDPLTMAMERPKIDRYAPVSIDGLRDVKKRTDWDIRLLTEDKPDYVVYSTFETSGLDRLSHEKDPSPVAKAMVEQSQAFMAQLKKDYEFDRQYGPGEEMIHDMMYVQPSLWIWKRKGTTP